MYILTLIMFPIVEKFFLFYLCGSPLEATYLGSLKDLTRTYKAQIENTKNPKLLQIEFNFGDCKYS